MYQYSWSYYSNDRIGHYVMTIQLRVINALVCVCVYLTIIWNISKWLMYYWPSWIWSCGVNLFMTLCVLIWSNLILCDCYCYTLIVMEYVIVDVIQWWYCMIFIDCCYIIDYYCVWYWHCVWYVYSFLDVDVALLLYDVPYSFIVIDGINSFVSLLLFYSGGYCTFCCYYIVDCCWYCVTSFIEYYCYCIDTLMMIIDYCYYWHLFPSLLHFVLLVDWCTFLILLMMMTLWYLLCYLFGDDYSFDIHYDLLLWCVLISVIFLLRVIIIVTRFVIIGNDGDACDLLLSVSFYCKLQYSVFIVFMILLLLLIRCWPTILLLLLLLFWWFDWFIVPVVTFYVDWLMSAFVYDDVLVDVIILVIVDTLPYWCCDIVDVHCVILCYSFIVTLVMMLIHWYCCVLFIPLSIDVLLLWLFIWSIWLCIYFLCCIHYCLLILLLLLYYYW